MSEFLVILGILVLVVGIYIGSYLLNSKTKKPEGVQEVNCESCHSLHCSMRNKEGYKDPEQCETERLD